MSTNIPIPRVFAFLRFHCLPPLDVENSGSPTNKQNTLFARKAGQKKQVEFSSQSDTDELPTPDYVPLY